MSNYIAVLDLEVTCNIINQPTDGEIIEFSCVIYKIGLTGLTREAEFQHFVKPVQNHILSDFCKRLTNITQQTVNKAKTFPDVHADFQQFIAPFMTNDNDTIILTCGSWGHCIQKELKLHSIPLTPIFSRYINIKREFAHFYRFDEIGMIGMMRHLQLPIIGHSHRAIDDCRNTGSIAQRMVKDGFNIYDSYINEITVLTDS